MAEGNFDQTLARLDDVWFSKGDPDALEAEVERAKQRFPGEARLDLWESLVLEFKGKFHESIEVVTATLARCANTMKPEDRAWAHWRLACALDRVRSDRRADEEFSKAAALAPDAYPVPPRLTAAEFNVLVREAVASIPQEFHHYFRDAAFLVRDYPPPGAAYGLALGTHWSWANPQSAAAIRSCGGEIFIYKRMCERQVMNADELRDLVRRTVVHEIAHQFGISHESMGEYV